MLFILALFMPFLALGFLFWYVVFRVGCAAMGILRPFLPLGRRGGGGGGTGGGRDHGEKATREEKDEARPG